MAINPESQYPGKIAPATPQYPYGAARNITVPGDGTGTPWEAAIVNDLLGFQQALLSGAAVVPSGTPDEVGASQYLEALLKLTRGTTDLLFLTVQDMQNGFTANGVAVGFNDDQTLTALSYATEVVTVWQVVAVEPVGSWYVSLVGGKWAKLIEVDGDIRRYGGADDWDGASGTNNKAAIDYLISKRPVTINLPKTRNGTGVYLYDGAVSSSSTDYSGVNLELDDGVTLHSTGLTNGEFWRKGVKYNREFKSKVADARYNLYSSPHQYSRPSEQFSRMTAKDGAINEVRLIDFSAAYVRPYELSAWPVGTLNTIAPVSATKPDIDLGTIPVASFKMAGVPVGVGDFIQANLAPGTVRPCVFVETDGGYVIVQQPPGSNSFQVVYSSGSLFDFDDDVFQQDEYRFDRAALGIIVYDLYSFGVCVNGVVIKRVDTTPVGGIQLAGWGAGFDSGNLDISRPSAFYNKKTIGIKPLKIVGIGDSTSAETLPPSQYQYLTQYLSGSCGAQVYEMKNLAAAGSTSSAQLAALQAENIENFDYCCIQIGINDVQTGVPSLTLLANIEAMIDECETYNVVPIIGLHTQWYLRADAQIYGQDGQNTGNSILAPQYRNAVMHGLADRGGVLMNTSVLEDEGAVLAQLLSKPSLDPIMQDNIHPTAHAQMAMGMSYAKAIIGHLTGLLADKKGVPMPDYWFNSGIGATVQPAMYHDEGRVETAFFFSRDGVTINDGDVIANIPERFRPLRTLTVPCFATTASSEVLTASPNGQLQIHEDGRVLAFNIDNTSTFVTFNASWAVQ